MEALRTLVAATGGRIPLMPPVRTMASAGGAGRDLPWDRGGGFMTVAAAQDGGADTIAKRTVLGSEQRINGSDPCKPDPTR
jgi:hypothetical protein